MSDWELQKQSEGSSNRKGMNEGGRSGERKKTTRKGGKRGGDDEKHFAAKIENGKGGSARKRNKVPPKRGADERGKKKVLRGKSSQLLGKEVGEQGPEGAGEKKKRNVQPHTVGCETALVGCEEVKEKVFGRDGETPKQRG